MYYKDLDPGKRVLMGPGPSDVHPRVLKAMATPLVGHLDPDFLTIMNETKVMLKEVFQTENEFTIPLSGTGSAGMEACLVNLLEPGDRAIVCVSGFFGERMVEIVKRCQAEPIIVESEWGTIVEPEQVEKILKKAGKVKLIAVVHAETSTGACQPLEELSTLAKKANTLFVVDTVTSLGGIPVKVDEWQIDATYSGTQKCLSCPPGLSPVSFSENAFSVINDRKHKIQSWYLDVQLLRNYWSKERFYHHTAPISMVYALRESLRLVLEEGLENCFSRHKLHSKALIAGLEAIGLKMFVSASYRLPEINAVYIPAEINDLTVRNALLNEYGIKIGGGLGKLKGKIWRIGLMGYTCRKENVILFLSALESIIKTLGYKTNESAILLAAQVYKKLENKNEKGE